MAGAASITTTLSATGVGGAIVLLADNFQDTAGTALGSHTMDLGPGWTVSSGDLLLDGNGNAYDDLSNQTNIGQSDSGKANATVTANVTIHSGGTGSHGLVFRFSDTNNYWRITVTPGTTNNFKIQERSGGSLNTRATGSVTINTGTAYTLQVQANGTGTNAISATVNGGSLLQFSNPGSGGSNTKHGIVAITDASTLFSQFLVTAP
jgi:hypothetical protein